MTLQGRFGIFKVSLVGRSDIDRIHALKKRLNVIRIQIQFKALRKLLRTVNMRIIYALHNHAADIFRLGDKALRNPPRPDHADPYDGMLLIAKHGGRDIPRPLQVYHLAVILQVLKGARPVRADSENVDIVFLNILHLLAHVILHDHLVRKSGSFHIFNALVQGIDYVQFSPGLVVLLGSDSHDQIIPKLLGPL